MGSRMTDALLLSPSHPLRLGDAVAAIIVVESDGYLMQLRDPIPQIWYPDHWGLFGGALDPGEEPLAALARELKEELEIELDPRRTEFFARFDFDLGGIDLPRYYRSYYVVSLTRAECARLVLHEGAEMRVFAADVLLHQSRISPYDEFALFLHYSRGRLSR
jgi:8-oxo-dGTP pyrophosphatase MutT (NUDIX family)